MTTYGIVGSRHWYDFAAFSAHLAGRGIEAVVSGGQIGVDTMAKRWADGGGIPCSVYAALSVGGSTFTEAAHRRNQQIVDEADSLIAFPCQHSKGTWDTIRRAKKKGIPIEVIEVDCEIASRQGSQPAPSVVPETVHELDTPWRCDVCGHEHTDGFDCMVIGCECPSRYQDRRATP